MMSSSRVQVSKLFPVMLSFVIMGFVDIIGVATGYVKQDFQLTDFIAQFLPMMVLLWFFILGVPAGVLQDKIGKRNMLNLGMVIQAAGLGPSSFLELGIPLFRFQPTHYCRMSLLLTN
jgi:FHS family L-fucose permease-like MFS transporter